MKALVNGVSLSYEDTGAGPALLLIHGFPLSSQIWRAQIDALKSCCRVIAPDLRGFGLSEAPAEGYSVDGYADDMAALLDFLGIRNAAVCGMSMGGYVLLNLLDRYPERVNRACFMVTRGGADDEEGKKRRTLLAGEVSRSGVDPVAEAFSRILFSPTVASRSPGIVSKVHEIMMSASREGLAGGLLAMRDRNDYSDRLNDFTVKALVIGAEDDAAIPAAESARLAAGLAHATLCMIPDAGHMVMMEQPEAVNRELVRFLAAA